MNEYYAYGPFGGSNALSDSMPFTSVTTGYGPDPQAPLLYLALGCICGALATLAAGAAWCVVKYRAETRP